MATQTVGPFYRTATVIEEGSTSRYVRNRCEQMLVLTRLKFGTVEERNIFTQNLLITRDSDVMRSRVRQPEHVVGTSRSGTRSRLDMPPMLHITLRKLSRRGGQKMLAGHLRRPIDQSHGILQLIPESVCAARLVEGRASPVTAAQNLIGQPAVQQERN